MNTLCRFLNLEELIHIHSRVSEELERRRRRRCLFLIPPLIPLIPGLPLTPAYANLLYNFNLNVNKNINPNPHPLHNYEKIKGDINFLIANVPFNIDDLTAQELKDKLEEEKENNKVCNLSYVSRQSRWAWLKAWFYYKTYCSTNQVDWNKLIAIAAGLVIAVTALTIIANPSAIPLVKLLPLLPAVL